MSDSTIQTTTPSWMVATIGAVLGIGVGYWYGSHSTAKLYSFLDEADDEVPAERRKIRSAMRARARR